MFLLFAPPVTENASVWESRLKQALFYDSEFQHKTQWISHYPVQVMSHTQALSNTQSLLLPDCILAHRVKTLEIESIPRNANLEEVLRVAILNLPEHALIGAVALPTTNANTTCRGSGQSSNRSITVLPAIRANVFDSVGSGIIVKIHECNEWLSSLRKNQMHLLWIV